MNNLMTDCLADFCILSADKETRWRRSSSLNQHGHDHEGLSRGLAIAPSLLLDQMPATVFQMMFPKQDVAQSIRKRIAGRDFRLVLHSVFSRQSYAFLIALRVFPV